MERKTFLKTLGLTGAASVLPLESTLKAAAHVASPPTCVLIPSETAGPFPLDLTTNPFYFRQDVREDRTGVVFNQKLRIIGLENCLPMANVRVNIWHCDKDGNYSGYGNQTGLTYLRGYQITDANGEVEFITIFPGWYNGRICHIHFQVYVSSQYAAISQLTYDIAPKNVIYAEYPALYTKGADPLNFNQDSIFADGYQYQLATLTPNAVTGGYDSFLEVSVQGAGTVGVGHVEKQNAKHFLLGQNAPNPFKNETFVPLTLHSSADVRVELYSLDGKKAATVLDRRLGEGEHRIPVDLAKLGLPTGNYAYLVEVNNAEGVFRDSKLMTAAR
ncbi:MAG: hypothetical protein IT270_11710 [Saprospiraceae bacterium]|nr:hypothetical protein [Saprospiraceae bacterium]